MKLSSSALFSFYRKPATSAWLAGLAILLSSRNAIAATGTWSNAVANAPWPNAANWGGGYVPNAGGDIADFSTLNITADRIVNLNSNRTVGTLIFGDTDPTHDWTLANGGTGIGNRITLDSGVVGTAAVIQVNNRTVTISAILAGTQGINKTGTGTLSLSNAANTLTGGYNVTGGLDFANGALGSNLVTISGVSSLGWLVGNTQDISSQVKINDGATVTLSAGANNITLATAFQLGELGTAAITKNGNGGITLTAMNAYTGATRVNAGTLILTGGDNRLSSATRLGLGNNANNGIFQLGDATGKSDQTVSGLFTQGTGTTSAIVGGHTSISTLTVNNTDNSIFSAALGGAAANQNHLALVKSGTGSLTLSSTTSNFIGDVTVNGGRLIVTTGAALGVGTKTVQVHGATDAPSFQLDGTLGSFNLGSNISFVTSNDDVDAPAILNIAGNNVINGNISSTTGGAGTGNTRIKVAAGTLTLNGNIAPTVSATGPLAIVLDSAAGAAGTATGVISDTGGNTLAVTKDGSGTWTLTGANTYTGNTTVNAGQLNLTTAQTGGGAISVGDDAILGVTLTGATQTLNTTSLTLGLNPGGVTGSQLSLNYSGFSNSDPATAFIHADSFTTNGMNIINVSGTGLGIGLLDLISYNGTIGGDGFASLVLGTTPARVTANLVDNIADGKVQLNISTFDVPKWTGLTNGDWDINTEVDPTIGDGTVNWKEAISGNETRYLQFGNVIDSVLFDDSAEGTTTVNLTSTLTPATVTVDNSALEYTFTGSGYLSGGTSIVKRGTGTLIIANTGANDNTGTTKIEGGTIQLGDGVNAGGQLGTGAVENGGALVFHRTDDFTFTNVISGAGSIEKKNTNSVTLSGNNGAFTGAIVVSEGVLKAGNANALGTTASGTTVESSGILDITGFNISEPLTLNGGALRAALGSNTIVSGPLTLNGGGILEAYNSVILTINTGITGDGGLTKTGNGTAILLSDSNSYDGTTTIRQGVLQIGVTGGAGTVGAIGSGDIHFEADAGNTATLSILRSDSVEISNTITSAGDGLHNISIGVTGANSKSGSVTLSGNNTFTGNVTVLGGILRIINNTGLGMGPKTVTVASNALPSLRLDGTSGNIELDSQINFAISSDGSGTNAGAIVNAAGDNIINGIVSIINGGGGQGQIIVDAGTTIDLAGGINTVGATGARTVLLGGAGSGVVSGVIEDVNTQLSVTKNGTGTWTLTGSNTYTGATNVNGGTLRFDAASAFTNTSGINLGNATNSGTLEFFGSADTTVDRALAVGGVGGGTLKNSSSNSSLLTLSGGINRGARPLTFQGGAFDVTGAIIGGAGDLNVDGATLTLTSTGNTYSGPTKIYGGGTLKNGATNSQSVNTTVTLGEATNSTSGTYDLNGHDATVLGLADLGTGSRVVTNSAASGTSILTINGTSTFGGSLQDGIGALLGLTKGGTGTFTLTNSQTYTGPTTVTGGTLAIGAGVSITSATTVTGGSLSLAGSIEDSVLVGTSGSLYAGGSTGTGISTIADSLTLETGSNTYFEINGTDRGAATAAGFDAIDGLIELTLSGTLHVNLGNGYTATEGDTFNLIDWTQIGTVVDNGYTFAFSGASLGPEYEWDTSNFLTTGSISIAATSVPEPGRAVLFVFALAALVTRRRRQQA